MAHVHFCVNDMRQLKRSKDLNIWRKKAQMHKSKQAIKENYMVRMGKEKLSIQIQNNPFLRVATMVKTYFQFDMFTVFHCRAL